MVDKPLLIQIVEVGGGQAVDLQLFPIDRGREQGGRQFAAQDPLDVRVAVRQQYVTLQRLLHCAVIDGLVDAHRLGGQVQLHTNLHSAALRRHEFWGMRPSAGTCGYGRRPLARRSAAKTASDALPQPVPNPSVCYSNICLAMGVYAPHFSCLCPVSPPMQGKKRRPPSGSLPALSQGLLFHLEEQPQKRRQQLRASQDHNLHLHQPPSMESGPRPVWGPPFRRAES